MKNWFLLLTVSAAAAFSVGCQNPSANSAATADLPATVAEAQTQSNSLVEKLTGQIQQLAGQSEGTLKDLLTRLGASVSSGDDAASAGLLQKIMTAKPSESQMSLLAEIRSSLAALALGRNFDTTDAATASVLNETLSAIKGGNVTTIVSRLKNIGDKVSLTDAQKELVGNLVSSWTPSLAKAGESVNKLLDSAKDLGL